MADLPPYSDSNGDTDDDPGVGPNDGSTTGTPRWVKIFGIIALFLVLLFVIMHLTGGGLAKRFGGHIPAPNVTEHGAQQP